MSFLAMLVAIWRVFTLRQAVYSVGPATRYDLSIRYMFLIGFALYMGGSAMRETVVLIAGATDWTDMMITLSATSRLIQIAGACVYVRGATVRPCGELGWNVVLGVSVLFALINPS